MFFNQNIYMQKYTKIMKFSASIRKQIISVLPVAVKFPTAPFRLPLDWHRGLPDGPA